MFVSSCVFVGCFCFVELNIIYGGIDVNRQDQQKSMGVFVQYVYGVIDIIDIK